MIRDLPVLIVDDEESLRDSMAQVLDREGYAVRCSGTGREGLAAFGGETFAAVFLDLRLPDMDGFSVLRQMHDVSPETPVVIITGFGTIESAVDAIKQSAFDYLTKPFTPEQLRIAAEKAAAHRSLVLENIRLKRDHSPESDFDPIVGQGKAMRAVQDLIAKAALSDAAVLVTGEEGTGKDLVARQIHLQGRRRAGPFVAVDCGALAEPAGEAEFFGTAGRSGLSTAEVRHGRLELANEGTLVLKDVSRLGSRFQGEILRVIETGQSARLGESRPRPIDVRWIALSGVNLSLAAGRGAVREDLYYRLSVIPIPLPPLRERKEDLPRLVDRFLKIHAVKSGKDVTSVSTRAMLVLSEYDWPGNLRELDGTIERAVVLARGRAVEIEDLMSHGISMGIPALAWSGGQFRRLEEIEKEYIKAVLRDQNGNRSRAAAILGIDRKTLWAKLKTYGLQGRDEA